MGIDFSAGAYYSSSALVTATPVTIAGWVQISSSIAIPIASLQLTATYGFFVGLSGSLYAKTITGEIEGTATGATTVPTGTWVHAAGVFTSNTNRKIWYNGGQDGSNTTNVTNPSPDTYILGSAYTYAVKLAEWGIWDVALASADLKALAKGYSPLLVRRSALKSYRPLIRTKYDSLSSNTITDVGSGFTATPHPQVFYPGSPKKGTFSPPVMPTFPYLGEHRYYGT